MSSADWAPFGARDDDDPPGFDAIEALLQNRSVPAPAVRIDRTPRRRLIVVSCMDARIDPLAALGLETGDAHVLRNAGAVLTDDVLRSIEVSRTLMGTEQVLVLGHSGCAAFETPEELRAALRESISLIPGPAAAAFYDLEAGRVEAVF